MNKDYTCFLPVPQCSYCKHYQRSEGAVWICSAFPEGIPHVILNNEFDHKQPYAGDQEIRWEQSAESLERFGPID